MFSRRHPPCVEACIPDDMHHASGTTSRIKRILDVVVVRRELEAFPMPNRNTMPFTRRSLAATICRRILSYGSLFLLNNFVVAFGWLSYSYGIMSSYQRNNFLATGDMFLEFENNLDNLAGGSSPLGDNSTWSSSQPPATPTSKRREQSRFLGLKRYVAANGHILMTISPGVEKPISSYVVRFSQVIGVCMLKTFPVHFLKWADIGREYIEVVKADLQRFFVLDFNDQAMNRFLEHQMLSTFKEFQDDYHRHFKKYSNPDEAQANPPNILVGRDEDWHFLCDHYISLCIPGRRPGYSKGLGCGL
ncbi:CACTA en-spm transposon protein [Cucumis melo var. makuwa]|uniref:CACTA en-spm transposon protein n=1 Tax=Cucumis melo var. makuwa TaxID=1194695 RepID=A0A5D3CRR6_CUCMM|nr:CACTA en-spm transposon protein [Cucumis melo var. makuwa]TYK14607.1 CACTA en-spm transposon protein [Cucumis melo var. makuwa]